MILCYIKTQVKSLKLSLMSPGVHFSCCNALNLFFNTLNNQTPSLVGWDTGAKRLGGFGTLPLNPTLYSHLCYLRFLALQFKGMNYIKTNPTLLAPLQSLLSHISL